MTPECTVAWHNYECKVNVTGYERRTQDAFVAGWLAATEAAVKATALSLEAAITSVNTAHNVPSPEVGHVCEGSPTGRKPSLCWICGQALPHDCVGSHPGHRRDSRLDSDALCGCSLPPHTIAQCVARGAERLTPPITHGPPRRFNGPTPSTVAAHARALAELHDVAEAPAKRLAVTGRKWPIGTPDETAYYYGTADEWYLRLHAARTHRGLTLDALGAKLDPPRTRKDISAMEHGRRGLSVELCAQLADALDCDRLWLAGWTL